MQSRWERTIAIAWVLAASLLAPACTPESTGNGGGGTAPHSTTGGSGGAPISCFKPEQCPEPESECIARVCKDSFCATEPKPNGSDAPTQVDGDCKKNICAGGEVIAIESSTDVPDDGTDCTIET